MAANDPRFREKPPPSKGEDGLVGLEDYIAALFYSRRKRGVVEPAELCRAVPTLAHAREVCRYDSDLISEADIGQMKKLKFWAEGQGHQVWTELQDTPLESIDDLKKAYELWTEYREPVPGKGSEKGYVGTVGSALRVQVRLKNYTNFTSRYDGSPMRAYKFEDREGNEFVWFSKVMKEYPRQDFFTIDCKVRAHTVYHGVPQTKINYVMTDMGSPSRRNRYSTRRNRYASRRSFSDANQ